jgi:hypothetical protein
MIFLEVCIRTKYYFYTECYWAVFSSTSTNFVLKSVVTLRPVFGVTIKQKGKWWTNAWYNVLQQHISSWITLGLTVYWCTSWWKVVYTNPQQTVSVFILFIWSTDIALKFWWVHPSIFVNFKHLFLFYDFDGISLKESVFNFCSF